MCGICAIHSYCLLYVSTVPINFEDLQSQHCSTAGSGQLLHPVSLGGSLTVGWMPATQWQIVSTTAWTNLATGSTWILIGGFQPCPRWKLFGGLWSQLMGFHGKKNKLGNEQNTKTITSFHWFMIPFPTLNVLIVDYIIYHCISPE